MMTNKKHDVLAELVAKWFKTQTIPIVVHKLDDINLTILKERVGKLEAMVATTDVQVIKDTNGQITGTPVTNNIDLAVSIITLVAQFGPLAIAILQGIRQTHLQQVNTPPAQPQ